MENKREVVVFDFDGTITSKDTFLSFICYTVGLSKFVIGFLIHSPYVLLMLLHVYPNWKVKQRIFSWFFKGMSHEKFASLGSAFAQEIYLMVHINIIDLIKKYVGSGVSVYVISASIEEWVKPFCLGLGATDVLSTKAEVGEDGCLTGHFASKNCYGDEKVKRLLDVEPNRDSYFLIAYGDSKGDTALMDFADKSVWVK